MAHSPLMKLASSGAYETRITKWRCSPFKLQSDIAACWLPAGPGLAISCAPLTGGEHAHVRDVLMLCEHAGKKAENFHSKALELGFCAKNKTVKSM